MGRALLFSKLVTLGNRLAFLGSITEPEVRLDTG